jgi:hypothetical protein
VTGTIRYDNDGLCHLSCVVILGSNWHLHDGVVYYVRLSVLLLLLLLSHFVTNERMGRA